jgi:hypothetical protein
VPPEALILVAFLIAQTADLDEIGQHASILAQTGNMAQGANPSSGACD